MQTKKLLHNKGNHQQKEKATYWMGEIFAKYISTDIQMADSNIQNI